MSTKNGRWDSYVDSLRLTEGEYQSLLVIRRNAQGQREDARGQRTIENTRACRRVCVQGVAWIPVELKEAGGESVRVRMYPVDLSATGMCVLTDRFVHKGVACVMTPHLVDGETLMVTGTCARCVLLHGRAHEVGVEFDARLDLGLVIESVDSATMSPLGKDEPEGASLVRPGVSRVVAASRVAGICGELQAIAKRMHALRDEADRLQALAGEIRVMDTAEVAPGASRAA